MIGRLPPPPRVIAVDVDDTLHGKSGCNTRLIAWCRQQKMAGFYLMLWSSRGEAHARNRAIQRGVVELFDLICSKPGYVVDDQGWGWIKYTKVIKSLSEAAQ